jgi:hypothetical protein
VTSELRQRLVDACRDRMVGEDSGSYDAIFDVFQQLITSLSTRGQTGGRKRGVARVRAQLKEFLARCTAHSHQFPGTARVIFGEMSGMAGSAIIRRLDKALRDVATKEGSAGASPVVVLGSRVGLLGATHAEVVGLGLGLAAVGVPCGRMILW